VSAVFHEEVPGIPRRRSTGRASCTPDAQVTVAEPLGFNNTFAILVRGADARSAACARSTTCEASPARR
jgi:hypothetical protein